MTELAEKQLQKFLKDLMDIQRPIWWNRNAHFAYAKWWPVQFDFSWLVLIRPTIGINNALTSLPTCEKMETP
jgi:hypothetical protein